MQEPGIGISVWLRSDQLALIAGAVKAAGLRVTAAGSPEPGRSAELAAALGAEPLHDLRAGLASMAAADKGLFLIADAGDFGSSVQGRAAQDGELLRSLTDRGVAVATMEPIPAGLLDLPAFLSTGGDATGVAGPSLVMLGEPDGGGESGISESIMRASALLAVPCPLWRFGKAVQDALEIMEEFGPVRAASLSCLGSPSDGSLGARLFDAMDLVGLLLGEPELIDASIVGQEPVRGLAAAPRETLRGLSGELCAHLRFSGGRAATVLASDRAGRFEFGITLLGTGGRVRISGERLEWIDAQGRTVDESGPLRARRGAARRGATERAEGEPAGAAALMGDQLARLAEVGSAGAMAAGGGAKAVDVPRVLAMAQAALLSARTGQAESPAMMMRMAR